jgi:hypothetical protein
LQISRVVRDPGPKIWPDLQRISTMPPIVIWQIDKSQF